MISDNTQAKPLDKTTVKCRFFAQYFEFQAIDNNDKTKTTVKQCLTFREGFVDNYHLELKPISKMTYEDICKLAEIIKEFNKNEDLNVLIKYVRESVEKDENFIYRCSFYVADVLRKLGYAISFDKYSVEDLVSFGWVRLV